MTQAEISAQVGVQTATATTTTLVPIIKGKLNEKQDAEDGKGLSTEDYTTAEKNKLAGIASGAEVNVIDSITVNSTAATVSNKTVALTIPTKVSDISNDSGFQTSEQVEASIDAKVSGVYRASESATLATLPALTKANLGRVSNMTESFTTTADFVEGAGITFPLGTNVVIVEALGGGYKYDVLAGFVDLSGKQDKLTVTGASNKGVYVSASGVVSAMTYEVNASVPANFAAASVAPLMDGTAAVGISAKYAREDHVHPPDTNKVNKVTGKTLSTNDYTDADKTKLSGIEAQANKTTIDSTLSNTGQAADAKATGDKIAALYDLISRMEIYCEASGNPATFSDAKAANVKALSVTLTPTQSGSGDPSPDNVRPISGVSSVTVTRTGKNLLGLSSMQDTSYRFAGHYSAVNDNELLLTTGSFSSDWPVVMYNLKFPVNGRFTLSGKITCADDSLALISLKSGNSPNAWGNRISTYRPPSGSAAQSFSISGSVSDGYAGVWIWPKTDDAHGGIATITSDIRIYDLQLEAGDSATEFEAYQGQSVAVSLVDSNSDPLTVYGGTLDVTAGTLTVTHKLVTLPTSGWSMQNNNRFVQMNVLTGMNTITSTDYNANIPAVCSHYKATTRNATWNIRKDGISGTSEYGMVYVVDTRFSTHTDFNAWLAANETPVQVCYELETPVTYQLTPRQLATLAGYNAVSSDAGTVDVTYKAGASLVWGGTA